MRQVHIRDLHLGEGLPLGLIAGPCAIESEDLALRTAETLADVCRSLGVPFVFKSSFDKANRSAKDAWRGPGLDEGLRILGRVRTEIGCPVTTDVHEVGQASAVGEVVDVLQIPAFLCRQTDLVEACGRTGRVVNVKKGQFLAPWDMRHPVEKALGAGASGVIATERGTTFGHGDLVVDLRGVGEMAKLGVPVCYDATHSMQRPGSLGTSTGGVREHADPLARAAIAAGVDVVFAEVHPDPDRALSDAATQLPLGAFPAMLTGWARVARAVGRP